MVKNKKHESNELADTTSESNSYFNNDDLDVQKPKKKKKHDKSFIAPTPDYSTDPYVTKNIIEESNANMVKKKKHRSNELTDTTSESNSYFKNDDIDVQKPKKNKKHDKSYIASTPDHSTDPYVTKNIVEESNANMVKKKKHKSNEIADTTSESNSYFNNDDLDVQKPKKKKKHDKSFIAPTPDYSTDPYVTKNIVEESHENTIKKKKHKSNEIADTTSESNSYFNNDDLDVHKPKKKKKHDKSFIAPTPDYSTDPSVTKNNVEESHENTIKKKKHKSNEIADITITSENSSYFNNDDLDVQKPKKNDKSFIAPTPDNSTDPYVTKNIVEESHENTIKKKKHKSNEIADITSESNSYFNNDDLDVQKPKKKKKHDKSFIAPTPDYSTDPSVTKNIVEESHENTIKKKKHKSNEIADITSESNSYFNNDDLDVQKPKKKKKHDKSFIAPTPDYSTDPSVTKNNVEESHENTIKKKKHESNEIADITITSENSSYFNNDDLDVQKPKKNDKSFIAPTPDNSTDPYVTKNIVEESHENAIKKKKHESNEIADITITSENSSYFKNDDLDVQKPKKNDKSFIAPTPDNSTDPYVTKNIVEESHENAIKKKKHKRNEIADTTLESYSYSNNEDIDTQKSKRKKKHDRNSVDSTFNNSTDPHVSKDLIEESYVRHDITDNVKNIQSVHQNFIESIDTDDTFNKSNINMNKLISNESNLHLSENGSDLVIPITQKNKVIEDILQAINLYKFENPSTTNEKVTLGEFNLINHVLKSKPSINNHKGFELIQTVFSNFMKASINLDGQVVTQSEIILLSSISKNILEKIIDAYDKSKIIEGNLHIELPPDCQNNKIHYLETALTYKHDIEKINLIRKINPAFKFGQFSIEEDNMIHKYWSKFQQEYNISDPRPFLSIRGMTKLSLPTKIKMQFVRYISLELPNRLLSSVYNRFNVLYSEQVNKLSFSEEEDKIIMMAENCNAIKNKISLLSIFLNRSKGQIFRRIHTFKMKPLRGKNISWDIYKLQELFTNILLETNTEDWNNLKDIKIKQDTWMKISKHFDKSINYEKCQAQWHHLKTRLFCETSIKYSTFKLVVLEFLMKINPKSWSDINWAEITNKLYPGASVRVINTIFHWWVTLKVPKELRKNVTTTLKYLKTNCLDSEIEKIKTKNEKEMTRLTVKDNNVLVEVK